jgi:hypothetical protein
LRCLGLRTVRKVARERGKVRGKRLGHGPSHVTSGSARYNRVLLINVLPHLCATCADKITHCTIAVPILGSTATVTVTAAAAEARVLHWS